MDFCYEHSKKTLCWKGNLSTLIRLHTYISAEKKKICNLIYPSRKREVYSSIPAFQQEALLQLLEDLQPKMELSRYFLTSEQRTLLDVSIQSQNLLCTPACSILYPAPLTNKFFSCPGIDELSLFMALETFLFCSIGYHE